MRFKQRDIEFDIIELDNKKIISNTATYNYIKISDWMDDIVYSKYPNEYKFNLNIGNIKLLGIFIGDYIFKQHCIEATFSIDSIQGDLELFKKKTLRKEKLKKLNLINGTYY